MRVDETDNSISIKRQQITSVFDQKFTKDYLLQADQINIGQIIEPQAESHPLDRRRWSEDPIFIPLRPPGLDNNDSGKQHRWRQLE
ncbi:hypothetical protein [Frankia sp. Cas4]|uniref:hypothetical protein n=1 Tax=Frankia sp. Cas4 TaxID=3073927 RepID=UPI002AD3F37D|nr:hypothetical protein [Frankia sp. Cas4]